MQHAPRDDEPATDSFERWEIEVISREVAAFLATRQESADLDRDDLTQQCLLHWWQKRGRHDPSRGASKKTFMARVVRAKLVDIERASKARKRGAGNADLSLEAPPGAYGEGLPLADVVRDLDADVDPEKAAEADELSASIHSAAQLLTVRQKKLLEGLSRGYNITEMSRQLRVSRPTLHDDLKRIRKVFRDEGLHEFLE